MISYLSKANAHIILKGNGLHVGDKNKYKIGML